MMTAQYLQNVRSELLDARPCDMPDERLVSLAAACAALWEYAAPGTPDARFVRFTEALFEALARCSAAEADPVLRGRMIGAMYAVACGTDFAADRSRERRCHRAADAFVIRYLHDAAEQVRAAVCRCIGLLLYPCPDPADEYLAELRKTFAEWTASLRSEGCWHGLPASAALERIALLDRFGGLVADPACEAAVRRAYAYYRPTIAVPAEPGNFDPASLPLLAALYDATADGFATRDDLTAQRISGFLSLYARMLPAGSAARCLCLSRAVHRAVREQLDRREEEDLVLYAFEHGHNGDLFVQKAPAATLSTLVTALKQIYSQIDPLYADTQVRIIGTRHGEKLYETLVTREEMVRAEDMGSYYRIPCDTRDLNYDKFFTQGDEKVAKIEDYHSHNTQRLDVEGMKSLLLRLRFVQEDLGLLPKTKTREIRSE